MKTKENQIFKAINIEDVFDAYLDECEHIIDCERSFRIDGIEYGADIKGNLLNEITLCEVYNPEDGKPIDIDHETLLKWANIELDKYVKRNFEAIKRTFPFQFEPEADRYL